MNTDAVVILRNAQQTCRSIEHQISMLESSLKSLRQGMFGVNETCEKLLSLETGEL